MRLFLIVLMAMAAMGAGPRSRINVAITVDGVQRTAVVHRGIHARERPSPVVLLFHGHGGHARRFLATTGMDIEWPEATVVSMQGLNAPGGRDPEARKPGWQKNPGELGDRDLRFVDAMLGEVRKRVRVDEARIYAAGFSNGGRMTYLLWTARPGVFAAVAPCASQFLIENLVAKARPKPALVIQGMVDRRLPLHGAQQSFDAVMKLNGCNGRVPWTPGEYFFEPTSAAGADTGLLVHAGGHEWPRAATASVVRFFKAHAK